MTFETYKSVILKIILCNEMSVRVAMVYSHLYFILKHHTIFATEDSINLHFFLLKNPQKLKILFLQESEENKRLHFWHINY